MKNWNIHAIEALKESEAKEMALETLEIKGHTIYLVDFEGYFKYSALVFLNGSHIYHANDYELHHAGKTREELRQWYIDTMNQSLYTESELAEVKDYDDYDLKDYYLRNYYGMQKPYISAFHIVHNDHEDMEYKKSIEGKIYNPVSFAYYAPEFSDFVKHHMKLLATLETAKNKNKNSYEYWEQAFYYEMCNHEYGINWQGNWDVCSVFGNVKYNDADDFNDYFDQLHFTETQRSAYLAARKRYFKDHEDL